MYSSLTSAWKIHRGDLNVVLRFLFWTDAALLAAICILGVWMLVQPESSFVVYLENTDQGLAVFSFFRESFEIDFADDVLNVSAAAQPKLVYGIGFLNLLLTHSIMLSVIWNLRQAFGEAVGEDAPVQRKGIFRAGMLLIFCGVLKRTVFPVLFAILQLGGGSLSDSWWRSILTGGIVVCLSFLLENSDDNRSLAKVR